MNIVKKLIELDGRRRASLGAVAHPEHSRYLIHAEPNGTIIMTPVDLVPTVVGERPAMLAPAATPEGIEQAFAELRAHEDNLKALRRLVAGAPEVVEP